MHIDTAARILGAMKRAGVVAILVLAFCGLADSVYIATYEMSGTGIVCGSGSYSDCSMVSSNPHAYLFGVPIAWLGVLFYSSIFVLAALELVMWSQFLRRVIQGSSLLGVLAALYFLYIQMFVIGAYCVYCLISGLIALIMFLCASVIEPIRKNMQQKQSELPPRVPLSHFSMPPMS